MHISLSRKTRSSILIMIIGVVAGVIYPLLSRELDDPNKVLNGVIMGFVGGGFIILNEVWLRNMFIRRLKFSHLILFKFFLYSTFLIILITLVISLDRSRRLSLNLVDYWRSPEFNHLIWKEDFFIMITYGLVVTVIFILLYLISKKMGQRVLWNFIIGSYHKPRNEKRIFMYLDLNNSTTIAEKLGDVKFHKLLNQFFFDITDSIVLHYGSIYRYVGDEVIVSWEVGEGLRKANFLRAFFSAKQAIKNKGKEYYEVYGLIPSFSAGIHLGEVVTGEIGEVKSEISYLGEVLHQTTGIEKACRDKSTDLLVSQELYSLAPEHSGVIIRAEHKIDLRGEQMIVLDLQEMEEE